MISGKYREEAFAFRLDAREKGFLYFRTVSIGNSVGPRGRDKRSAYPVIVDNFQHIIRLLGESLVWVRNDKELERWLAELGWMLAPTAFAQERLACLLDKRTCVKSAIGLFWDVAIPRNRAASRRICKCLRQRMLDRDGHKCIECGKGEADGVELTMDHVIPFSRGGETTEGNLVTLCKSCNQGYGNVYHPHLFALAGLHHGWDPDLVKTLPNADVLQYAMMLSQNIMVSRSNVEHVLPPGRPGGQGADSTMESAP